MNSEQYREDESSMDLPPVVPRTPEQGNTPVEMILQQGTERNPEADVSQGAAVASQPATTDDPAASAQPVPATTDPQAPVSPPTATAMPQIADDTDLIEKEWVEKAHEIINRTKSDPHEQSKELGKIKAEYLKKRFNRQLKTSKDSTK